MALTGIACENSVLVARVAVQALVEVLVDLVAVDAVRDGRRLHGVVARAPVVVVDRVAQRRRLGGGGDRRRAAHRHRRSRRRLGAEQHDGQQAEHQEDARASWRSSCVLDLDDLHGALLEVGLERDRVGRVERHLVDELAGVEPGHEHQAARRLVAAARLDARAHAAAARADLHLDAAPHAERRGVVRDACSRPRWAPPCTAPARGASSSPNASARARGRSTARTGSPCPALPAAARRAARRCSALPSG